MAQCSAPREDKGVIWYCVREKDHDGEHKDDEGRRWSTERKGRDE